MDALAAMKQLETIEFDLFAHFAPHLIAFLLCAAIRWKVPTRPSIVAYRNMRVFEMPTSLFVYYLITTAAYELMRSSTYKSELAIIPAVGVVINGCGVYYDVWRWADEKFYQKTHNSKV
jgi:hypothetical protein